MARPSMAGQRREEILDALELCILEKGIQATSLEYLAEKAQMKRSILRHYIGNRDDILVALSERWRQRYLEQWQQLLTWLPKDNRVAALLENLFTVGSKDMVSDAIIGEAIFSEAKRLDAIKAHQQEVMNEFINVLMAEFGNEYPNAEQSVQEVAAHGVYANYLMFISLLPLAMSDELFKQKQAAKLICSVMTMN